MAIVGTAYVAVKVLSKQLSKDIKESVEKSMNEVKASIDKMGEDIGKDLGESIGKNLGESIGDSTKDSLDGERDDINNHMDGMGRDASQSFQSSFSRDVQNFQFPIDLWEKREKEKVKGWFGGGGEDAAESFRSHMRGKFDKLVPDDLFGKLLKPGLFALIGAPAIAGAMTIVSGAVAGVIGGVQLLGQAAGAAGGVMVGLGASMATALIAGFMIFKTEGPLLDAFKKKIGDLSGAWNDVGKQVQAAALPQIGDAIAAMSNAVLPAMKDNLIAVGGAIGNVADKFKALAENASFGEKIREATSYAAPVIEKLFGALVPLLDVIVTIASAVGPLTQRFADWVAKMADLIAVVINGKKESGELTETFNRWGDVAARLGAVLGDFGAGFWNVLKASAPLAEQLLQWMEKGAQAFRDWSDSASGEQALSKFFTNAIEILREVGGLLGDIAKIFGEGLVGDPSGTIEFIQALREDLIPALETMFDALKSSGPSLVDLFVTLAGVVEDLANSGALGAITTSFQLLADILNIILQIPFAGQILGMAGVLAIGTKAAGHTVDKFKEVKDGILAAKDAASKVGGTVSTALTGLPALGDKIKTGFSAVGGVLKTFGSGLALVGRTIMMYVVPAIWSWTAALLANPITWIVVGIVALIAIFVVLWKKFEWFREFWIGLWEKIKDVAGAVWDWLKAAFSAVVDGIMAAVRWIGDIFSTVFEGIKTVVGAVWDFIKAAFEIVFNIISAYINVWLTIFQTVFGIIKTVVEVVWNAIKAAFEVVWNFIKAAIEVLVTIFQAVFGAIQAAVEFVWNAIKAAFELVWNAIKFYIELLQTIFEAVFNAIQVAVEFVWNAIKAAWDILWNAISAALDVLKSIFEAIFNAIKTVVETVWNAIKAAWDFLWNAIKAGLDLWKSIFTTIFNAIKTVVLAVWDGIKAAWDVIWNAIQAAINVLKGVFETVFNAIKGVVSGVWNGIKAAWDVVYNAISGAVNTLKGIFESVFNTIKGIVTGVWNGIKSGVDGVMGGIKSAINIIISGINLFIKGINAMSGAVSKIPGVPDIPKIPEIPKLAKGGIVPATFGGQLVRLAEAGKAERVEPLDENGLSKRDKALIDALKGPKGEGLMDVRVFIGDTELTDIVRVEIGKSDKRNAMAVAGGARWP